MLARFRLGFAVVAALALSVADGCACDEDLSPVPVAVIDLIAADGARYSELGPDLVLDAGRVALGGRTEVLFEIRSLGPLALDVEEICLVGASVDELDEPCLGPADTPFSLPGQTGTLTVAPFAGEVLRLAFSADALGDVDQALRIRSNAEGRPVVVVGVRASVYLAMGTVEGCLCDEVRGAWREGAIARATVDGETYEAVADAAGCFSLELPAGDAVVDLVDDDTGFFDAVSVTVGEGETVALDSPDTCALDEGLVQGCVCNDDATAWAEGVTVTGTDPRGDVVVTTDGDGCFSLALAVGDRRVTVDVGAAPRVYDVTVRADEATSIPTPEVCAPGVITGCVCNDFGTAWVDGAVVAVGTGLSARTTETGPDGCFRLEGVPPGEQRVRVVGGSVDRSFDVVVVGGDTVALPDPGLCEPCETEASFGPVPLQNPADIVFSIDSSASMVDENEAVEANINAFSQAITDSGIDHRVVLIGRTVVPAPLGGSDRLLHVDREVDSDEALPLFVEEYPAYQSFLRADADLHLIAITDDTSRQSDTAFLAALDELSPPGLSPFVLHAVVGTGPVLAIGCATADGLGDDYVRLAESTGGLVEPICDADFAAVLDEISAAVERRGLPCELPLPDAAPGTAHLAQAVLRWTPGTGGAESALPYDPDCESGGFRFDDVDAPTAVEICPASCAGLSLDDEGALDLSVACRRLPASP